MRLPKFLTGQEGDKPQSLAEHDLLPPSILFALRYNGAQLGKKQIEPLLKSNLANLGFYLLMKAAEDDDQLQIGLLRDASRNDLDYTQLDPALVDEVTGHLSAKTPPTVNGKKLAEVSRAGFGAWNDRFGMVLDAAGVDNPDRSLFMIANSPYIGLDKLAAHSLAQGRNLGILKPNRFDQTELPVGLMIEAKAQDWQVRPLGHDFVRPESAIIFDDVRRHGQARDQVLELWAMGSATQPDFITAVNVSPDSF